MDDQNKPHLYGTPDPKDQAPPPAGGFRGEGSAPLAEPSEELTHKVDASGQPLTVQETSGTAYAEATGKDGTKQDMNDTDDNAQAES